MSIFYQTAFSNYNEHEGIVGVQPMTGPVGLVFALRFSADQEYAGASNTELGYNTIDPYYSGDQAACREVYFGDNGTCILGSVDHFENEKELFEI